MSARVVVALRVAATPERAFEAFTAEIGRWWHPDPLFRFTPRSPGVLSFEPGEGGRLIETFTGGKVFEVGKIEVWDPPHRLAVGWRQATFAPGQDTRLDVRFDAVGAETRVTVEHSGWEHVPQDHVARHRFSDADFLKRHGDWWRNLLMAYNAASFAEDRRDG